MIKVTILHLSKTGKKKVVTSCTPPPPSLIFYITVHWTGKTKILNLKYKNKNQTFKFVLQNNL